MINYHHIHEKKVGLQDICWLPVILGINRLQRTIRGSRRISGSTSASWYWNSGTYSRKKVTSIDLKKNCFRFAAFAFDSWRFMLIFMAFSQLKIVDVVQSIAYKNFDLLVSCSAWDLATLLMVDNSILSVRSHTVVISILPLLDLRASGQCSASSMGMLAPIGLDPYSLIGSPCDEINI